MLALLQIIFKCMIYSIGIYSTNNFINYVYYLLFPVSKKNVKKIIFLTYIMEIILIIALIIEAMVRVEIFKLAWDSIVDLRKK